MKKPVIAIPIGDPAGVGPEIVAKSIASDEVFQIAVCVIVGDRKILEKAIEITGENLKINEIKEPDEAVDEKGVLNLIDLDNVDLDTFAYGKVSGMCGKAAYEYIAKLAGNGYIEGYPDGNFGGDRLMTRYEFAAMLYRAIENGAALEEKIIKEFEPELGRIRVDRISGEDGDRDKIERVRVNDTKGERDHYGNKLAK